MRALADYLYSWLSSKSVSDLTDSFINFSDFGKVRVEDVWLRQKFLTKMDWHLAFIILALTIVGILVVVGFAFPSILVIVDILS